MQEPLVESCVTPPSILVAASSPAMPMIGDRAPGQAFSPCRRLVGALSVLLVLHLGADANAQSVLYSNIQPGDPFGLAQYGSVPAVVNSTQPFHLYQGIGARFVSQSSGLVGAIEVPVALTCNLPTANWNDDPCAAPQQLPIPAGAENPMWFTIMSDNSGVPGTVLAVSSPTPVGSSKIYSFSFSSGAALQSGSTYWVRGDTMQSQFMMGWEQNRHAIAGTAVWGGSFSDTPKFSYLLDGLSQPAFTLTSAVPEPPQVVLLAFGLVLIRIAYAGLRRRDRVDFASRA